MTAYWLDEPTWDWPERPQEAPSGFSQGEPLLSREQANGVTIGLVSFAVGGSLVGTALATPAEAVLVTSLMLAVWVVAFVVDLVWG